MLMDVGLALQEGSMTVKKLAWRATRARIMQSQDQKTSPVDGCWAAVVESALAFYTGKDQTLDEIERQLTAAGGRLGEHGARSFTEVLQTFNIYAAGKKNPEGFAQTAQVFNFVKQSIDAGRPVILGWKGAYLDDHGASIGFKHAGLIFGYDDDDGVGKIFAIEPAKIIWDVNYANYLSTPQTMRAVFFEFGNMKAKVTEIYKTKPPTAAAAPPETFTPLVINPV
jgi:hypothetical protein